MRAGATRSPVVPQTRWAHVRTAYEAGIVERQKEAAFLLTLAFLLMFAAVRLITHGIKNGWLPFAHNVAAGGVHVHHMVPGMLLVLLAGYLSILLGTRRPTQVLAVLFGIGAALVLDEFALWLRLADVYWEPEGRESIDAVVIAGGVATLGVLGLDFGRMCCTRSWAECTIRGDAAALTALGFAGPQRAAEAPAGRRAWSDADAAMRPRCVYAEHPLI